MKCIIFTSLILAAPMVSALRLPQKTTPPAARSVPVPATEESVPAPEEPIEPGMTREDFDRVYAIVHKFVENEDFVGLSALNFISGNEIEDYERVRGDLPEADVPVVAKRSDFRPPSAQFDNFSRLFGQN